MNYLIVQSFFDNIFSLVLEHRITLGIFWFFLFGYFLWRLSKKDIVFSGDWNSCYHYLIEKERQINYTN